jgi:hypothetical protein
MTISMHSASLPTFTKMLGQLSLWLDKAEAHATTKKFDMAVLLNARLAPDMLPLIRQVQIACDAAKFGVARLAAVEAPKMDDAESTLPELKDRIQRTLDFIRSVDPDAVAHSEEREIQVPIRGMEPLSFRGEDYLHFFAIPNFYFHLTTTYAILRHNGVELGKADFLGRR